MKFFAATTVLSLLAAAEAANSHNGVRRSVDFAPAGAQRHGTPTLNKRMPLGGLPGDQPKMMKSLKRASFDYNEKRDLEAHAGFGSMPILENRGMSSIMGLTERTIEHVKRAWSHDGKQGTSKAVQSSSGSSDSSSSSGSTDTSGSDGGDDDDEECEEDDEEGDDEDCEEDDEDDDEEDCDDEADSSDDSTASSTSSSDAAAPTSSDTSDSTINSVVQNAKDIVKPSSTSSSSSAAASSTGSSDAPAKGNKNTGIATWFTQNGNPGNCGNYNQDSGKGIALYSGVYDGGKNCGRTVMIKNLQDGTSTTANVWDSCPTCGDAANIDLSVGAMKALDPNYQTNGIRKVEWYYID